MKSTLVCDDFFITIGKKYYSNKPSKRWSLLGLQIISGLITPAVEKVGINPAQVIVSTTGGGSWRHESAAISIAWPGPNTVLIKDLTVAADKATGMLKLVGTRRGYVEGWYTNNGYRKSKLKKSDFKVDLLLADPGIIDQLANHIQKALPKNSKFMEKT